MKAIVYHRYGPPRVLGLEEVDRPIPSENQVLVKLYAASVNAADLDLLRGRFMVRPGGLLRPKYKILGSDIAGRVESVGKNVHGFSPGDEVFGDLTEYGFGAFAEYVSVPSSAVTTKPTGLTFEEAAAVPSAGTVALLNLSAKRPIDPGQKVLINGAGGGMGTFAIQIAKAFGAEVTGVDNTEKLDMMRSIGADHVIDYAREDFTKNGLAYDLILDLVATRSISACRRALRPDGIYLVVGGSTRAILRVALREAMNPKPRGKSLGMVMQYPNLSHLERLKELLETRSVMPIIGKTYPLQSTPEAMRILEEGRALGKLVITVRGEPKIGCVPTRKPG